MNLNKNKVYNSYRNNALDKLNKDINNSFSNKEINLLKSEISELKTIISQYDNKIKEYENYIYLCHNFFYNVNQISMNQINFVENKYNNKIVDINLFQSILNQIQNYIIFLQQELVNMNTSNINNSNPDNNFINSFDNEIQYKDNLNNEYKNNNNQFDTNKAYYMRNINNNKLNPQYDYFKTLEDRVNMIEKELNLQKQNFINIKQKNAKKKKILSKAKMNTALNINNFEEESKINKYKEGQIKNNNAMINKNKIILNNQTNYNGKYLGYSNKKSEKKIRDNERNNIFKIKNKNKKRSITPINSRKYFN